MCVFVCISRGLFPLKAVLGTVIRKAVVRTRHDSSVRITNIFKPLCKYNFAELLQSEE